MSRQKNTPNVPREPVAAQTVAVVLPKTRYPGLRHLGSYVPGVTYQVDQITAERLMARGFQIAAVGSDTADTATAADTPAAATFSGDEDLSHE